MKFLLEHRHAYLALYLVVFTPQWQLNSCNQDIMLFKAENTYHLALCKKSLLTLEIVHLIH